jgi:hypothetical protein
LKKKDEKTYLDAFEKLNGKIYLHKSFKNVNDHENAIIKAFKKFLKFEFVLILNSFLKKYP